MGQELGQGTAPSPRRLHVVSLPHTNTVRSMSWCAYTEKTRKFCDMMSTLDYHITLYANEHNDAACDEHVVILSEAERVGFFPPENGVPQFNPIHPGFALHNMRAAQAIKARAQPGDILCIIGGRAQQFIADANPDLRCVEFGVGYEGVFSSFRVFESYAWMHVLYGHQAGGHGARGQFYDVVIPNYFEVPQFPVGKGDGEYMCFVGRLIDLKGWRIAVDVTRELGVPLHVAGDGKGWPDVDETLEANPHVVYRGVVEPKERAEIFGGAICTFAPTLYVEPFGGVAVESQLCGTPVITTDWGAFPETVMHGSTGFRCRTFGEFLRAATCSKDLDRTRVRRHALRYGTDVVKYEYDAFFNQLATLDGVGWYDQGPGRI